MRKLLVLLLFAALPALAQQQINLTTQVRGLLPVANGGIGVGTLTGLALGNGTSAFSPYTGTSCTNQFPRSLNASGAATCASVANADLAGGITLTNLATQATNTVVGNATAGAASPTALAVGSCSASSSALIWTTNTGFGCNTAIVASSSGTATTATNATNTAITDDTTTNATMYPTWVTTTTGNLPQKISSSKLTFNPSTSTLTATNFAGNASTVTTNANLTGPITSSGNTTSIASQTGTGTKFVVDTSPVLVTPNIGIANGTSAALTGMLGIGGAAVPSAGVAVNATTYMLTGVGSAASALVKFNGSSGDQWQFGTGILSAGDWGVTNNTHPVNPIVIGGGTATPTITLATNVSIPGTLGVTGHVTLEGVTSTAATGSGKLVFDTSPAFITPALGTPTSGTLTNTTDNRWTVHTRQVFLTGSAATYTTPSNARQIVVRMKGGGGGGSGTGTTGPNNGGTGGDTIFNSIHAAGGIGGSNTGASAPGAGGTAGTGTADVRIAGMSGGGPSLLYNAATTANLMGGIGGGQGSGQATTNGAGNAAVANSGGGGPGGSLNTVTVAALFNDYQGFGGGEGEYVELVINSPAGSYTYTVGAVGTAGAAGTGGNAGGAGGTGYIIVDEYY